MALSDFNRYKQLSVTSASGTPTVSRTQCLKVTSGDDSTTGTGEIVLDWTNVATKADIGIYDENDNLLDYHFEDFDATAETAVIWVYRAWTRDGSAQVRVAYGNGPSDQSVVASTVFDKETDLVAGYLFNEASGNLLDVTSNNNDGTLGAGVTQEATGMVDGAYNFNNDVATVSDNTSLDLTGDHTLISWIYLTQSLAPNDLVMVINKGGDYRLEYDLAANGSDYRLLTRLNGTWYICVLSSKISLNTWTRIAIKVDKTNSVVKAYVNGAYEAQDTGSITVSTNANDLTIGTANWNTYQDNAKIYNTAISEDDEAALYDASKAAPSFFSQGEGIPYRRIISATVSATPALTRKTSKGVSASLGIVAMATKKIPLAINATISANATVSTVRIVTKLITASMSMASQVPRLTKKNIAATLSGTGSVTRKVSKVLLASVSTTGSVAKKTSKMISASISTTASVSKTISHAVSASLSLASSVVTQLQLTIAAVIGYAGTRVRKFFGERPRKFDSRG